MNDLTRYTFEELGPEARERALALGREQAMGEAALEISTALRARGFRAAKLEMEVETPGEPDGVAFYGNIKLRRVARTHPEIRKRLRIILRRQFAVAAQVNFIAKVGNYYQSPTSMCVQVRADPVSEAGEIESASPYEPERPEVVDRAVYSLERRLKKIARATADEMLPIARGWLGRLAILERLRGEKFTKSGDPCQQ